MRTFLISTAILASVSATVLAQAPPSITTSPGSSQTIDDIRKEYRVHGGPFYVNPAILLKELGVDTNVFNQAGTQQSDFTFTITPQADVAIPVARRALFRTSLGTDLVYFHKFASERSVDPQLTARGEFYANRITLFVQESYLNTRQRPNFEIDLRSRHLENDLGGGASVQLTPKLAVEVAGLRGETRFDADAVVLGTSLREVLNRNTTVISVAARDRWTPLTTLSVRYEKQQDLFPFAPVRDTDSFRIMPGVEFRPKALINGSAFVGYRSFTPRSPLLQQFNGLVSRLGLSYTLLGATTFGVTFDRDLSYSIEEAAPYYVDNSIGAFVRRALGVRFDLVVSGATHRYAYQDLRVAQPAIGVPPRLDTTNNFGANVGYRMKGNTRVGFGANYYTRRSTRALRQYDDLRLGTTVTYGF